MITKLNIGCNFDYVLLDNIIKLNKKYRDDGIQVKEFYGSLQKSLSDLPTARSDDRLIGINERQIISFISKCHDNDILFNYTLNSPLTSDWFEKTESNYRSILFKLTGYGIDIITIAHPLPLKYLSKLINNDIDIYPDIDIEISTILDVYSFDAIKHYIDDMNIDKICLSLRRNRDFKFLTNLSKSLYVHNAEILVNEFCNVKGIPCQDFYRKSCYELHALGGNADKKHSGYPLDWCTETRKEYPESWLKANVILPHDLHYYERYGFRNFKISGRTLPTKFILRTTEAYLSRGKIMDDNILALWGHVNRSYNGNKLELPKTYISAIGLDKIDFLKFFIYKNFSCEDILCAGCNYCKNILDKLYGKNKKS